MTKCAADDEFDAMVTLVGDASYATQKCKTDAAIPSHFSRRRADAMPDGAIEISGQ